MPIKQERHGPTGEQGEFRIVPPAQRTGDAQAEEGDDQARSARATAIASMRGIRRLRQRPRIPQNLEQDDQDLEDGTEPTDGTRRPYRLLPWFLRGTLAKGVKFGNLENSFPLRRAEDSCITPKSIFRTIRPEWAEKPSAPVIPGENLRKNRRERGISRASMENLHDPRRSFLQIRLERRVVHATGNLDGLVTRCASTAAPGDRKPGFLSSAGRLMSQTPQPFFSRRTVMTIVHLDRLPVVLCFDRITPSLPELFAWLKPLTL